MKDLVEFVVRSLVDNPDEVQVSEIQDNATTILELRVAETDMGRVIGKSGRVINAIRSLVSVGAAKQGKRISLELIDSGRSR